jgi:hypothetical protein
MGLTRRAFAALLLAGAVDLIVPMTVLARGGGGRSSGRSSGGSGRKGQSSSGGGSHYVSPHTRKDGTYVPGHRQTNPDNSKQNNWSTKGNVNPYTGKAGTRNP